MSAFAPFSSTHTQSRMNRLKDFFGDPQEPESQDDFYEVDGQYDSFAVSRETAIEIERRLD